MLDAGLAPKTVRNVITFMHSVFEDAIDRGWTRQNPVRRASRPKRGTPTPDIQFLTVPELEPVLRAIPDEVVVRAPAPRRRGRACSAPPIPPDVLGHAVRCDERRDPGWILASEWKAWRQDRDDLPWPP